MKYFFVCFLIITSLSAQKLDPLAVPIPNQQLQQKWVNQLYRGMSLKEKIGQLFMPMVFSERDSHHFQKTKELIEKYHIGGVIFSLGGPKKQSHWLNALQKASKVPLLVAMDLSHKHISRCPLLQTSRSRWSPNH